MRSNRTSGTPQLRSAFHRPSLSTESHSVLCIVSEVVVVCSLGADLKHCENARRIHRPIGVYAGYRTNLRIYGSAYRQAELYGPKTELRTLRIYRATNQSIIHSLRITDPTDLQICRPTRICGAVHTDVRGCLWIYTTELSYSLSGFVWVYIYGLSGLKFKKTIHMK